VVPDLTFDGPAPPDETRQLRQTHPGEGRRDNGFTRIRTPGFGGQVRQFPDRAPAALEFEPHMPSAAESSFERSLGEESLECRLVGPLGEHGEASQLRPMRGHDTRTQSHPYEDFGDAVPPPKAGARARRPPRAAANARDERSEWPSSILGTWTRLGDLSHLGLTGRDVEGPMWAKFNDRDEWVLWLDQYRTGRGYMPVTSTNLGSTGNFQTRSDYQLGTTHKRHGSVLNLTATEADRVRAGWGSAQFNRLQSYNFPNRYVRHRNFDVLLHADVSPAADARFRIVPGLADPAAVSFEAAANFPGHYLRHKNFDFTLAADATFIRVSGLADASLSSFRSYNHPDHHIRHYAYALRLDPITTATGRAAATFRVTS
jgi:hypothetical protein